MKTFLTIVSGVLLALSCVTASDARQNVKRQAPTQNKPTYYDQERDRPSPSEPSVWGAHPF
jgi:hypothetical protein